MNNLCSSEQPPNANLTNCEYKCSGYHRLPFHMRNDYWAFKVCTSIIWEYSTIVIVYRLFLYQKNNPGIIVTGVAQCLCLSRGFKMDLKHQVLIVGIMIYQSCFVYTYNILIFFNA